ncbi:MAG: hypothetical protein KDB72_07445 [Mycobacterium sp.]|nr:hypothetical protein [Mycobacterium sp.]
MKKLLSSLTEKEYLLIRQTATDALAGLDEDALIDLHDKVRRARKKYVTLYRRKGAAKVGAKGARGAARSANERNGAKAEIFEDALARVSRQLSVAARRSARDLKDERLARARGDAAPAKPAKKSAAKVKGVARVRVADSRKSPARKKRDASTLAKGARRQAKRDSRRG